MGCGQEEALCAPFLYVPLPGPRADRDHSRLSPRDWILRGLGSGQEEGTHLGGLWTGDRTLGNGHGYLTLTCPVTLLWLSFGIWDNVQGRTLRAPNLPWNCRKTSMGTRRSEFKSCFCH